MKTSWWKIIGIAAALALGACGGDEEETGESEEATEPVEAVLPLPDASPIMAGEDHTCAITEAGDVFCWGRNLDGELGDGTGQTRRTPVPVVGLTSVHQLAGSRYHTCALKRDGTVWCWGRNDKGQLGDGTTDGRAVPVQVTGLADATQVTTGQGFSCALLRAGTVSCWGDGSNGRLGNGNADGSPTPVEVMHLAEATQISAGRGHACARRADGTIACWGSDSDGQAGVPGDARQHLTAQAVPGLTGIAAVAAGASNTCARHDDGHLSCWGDIYEGLVGNGQSGGDPDDVGAPFQIPELEGVAEVGIGKYQVCARLESGEVRCWGDDGYGNLGGEERGDHASPSPVHGLTDAQHLAVGYAHICVVRATGAISCWGKSGEGQLGIADVEDAYHANDRIPSLASLSAEASTIHQFAGSGETQARPQLSGGDGYACGVRNDGHVLCWGGSNSTGQLGNGTTLGAASGAIEVIGITDAVEVRTSSSFACARRATGQVACWGFLSRINGSAGWVRTSRAMPLEGVDDARGLAVNGSGPCVVRENGSVGCLTGGSVQPIADLTGVAQLAGGGSTMCARLEAGGVRCWGAGSSGQIGNGADDRAAAPTEVAGITDATQIAFGTYHGCALRGNGSVSCWGRNHYGQVGNGKNGDEEHENRPVAVRGVRGAVEVSASRYNTCVRNEAGEMQCWGANDHHQCGSGQEGDDRPQVFNRPVAVAAPSAPLSGAVAQLELGSNYGCVLSDAGQVACWGSSSVLGQGSFGGLISSRSPVPRPLPQVSLGAGGPPPVPTAAAEAAPAEAAPAEAAPAEAAPEEAPIADAPAQAPAAEAAQAHPRQHRTAVERAVRTASRACYMRNASHGAVTVRVNVGHDGRVITSQVVANATGNRELGRCISGALVGRQFSRPRQGAVTYDIPFSG